MAAERLARRLALLEGVSLSQADLESITAEFAEFDRVLGELEPFAEAVPWLPQPVQPERDQRWAGEARA